VKERGLNSVAVRQPGRRALSVGVWCAAVWFFVGLFQKHRVSFSPEEEECWWGSIAGCLAACWKNGGSPSAVRPVSFTRCC